MDDRQDLLQPSLVEQDSTDKAIYSARAGFLTGFFGGPFAALALSGLNSRRLDRLSRDLPLYVIAAAAAVALLWLLSRPDLQGSLRGAVGSVSPNVIIRAFGLACFGLGYLLHRQQYRLMQIAGIASPNGWKAGLACGVAGFALQALIAIYFARGHAP